ncbi:type II toxin-antitoxin system VapC family toxin [Pseudoxanthomonas sp.]|uniref:type II toxin-antitoxin system VapC family toxin n=1 Tax=Pseudoxanthomonas sp. TaxID=1871049 RepID=UPI0028C4F17C|nr:type II toxin-antitoxin system VapC family toxin [Pseudoxanthomonas sp.]
MYYVDTSVLVSALTVEAGSQAAREWLAERRPGEVFVSHWTATEFSSSLSIKQRRGEIARVQRDVLLAKYDEWTQQVFRVLPVSREDFDFATRLASHAESGLRSGGALHASIARNHGLPLCTLDKGLSAAGVFGVDVRLIA